MISIELKIAPCSAKTMVAPAAWFVPGSDPARWLDEIVQWRCATNTLSFLVVPTRDSQQPLGVVVCGVDGGRSSRAQPYRQVGQRLLIPCDAELLPRTSEPELSELLAKDSIERFVWHPVAGLVGFEPQQILSIDQLLSVGPATDSSWRTGNAGVRLSDRMLSVSPANTLTLQQVITEGGDDIGTEESLDDVPRSPDESNTAGLRDAFRGLQRPVARAAQQFVDSRPGGADHRTWIDALGDWANRVLREGAASTSRRANELRRLMHMLDNDPDKGLRYAVPFGGENRHRGMAAPSDRLVDGGPLDYGRIGSGAADYWDVPWEIQHELLKRYRELAERESRMGRHRRAAHIYANLLGDFSAAAAALRAGGHFREAALLYKEKLGQSRTAAECLKAAGLWHEAIEIYEELGDWTQVAELYEQLDDDKHAKRAWHKAVEMCENRADYLHAAKLLEQKLDDVPSAIADLKEGWRGSREPKKCLKELFDLYARKEDTVGASSQIDELADARFESAMRDASAAETLVSVSQAFPALNVRQSAVLATRRIAARNFVRNTSSRFLNILKSLEPNDQLLGRDCERYKRTERHNKPREISREKVEFVNRATLGKQTTWHVTANDGDLLYLAGYRGDAFVIAASQYDYNSSDRVEYYVPPGLEPRIHMASQSSIMPRPLLVQLQTDVISKDFTRKGGSVAKKVRNAPTSGLLALAVSESGTIWQAIEVGAGIRLECFSSSEVPNSSHSIPRGLSPPTDSDVFLAAAGTYVYAAGGTGLLLMDLTGRRNQTESLTVIDTSASEIAVGFVLEHLPSVAVGISRSASRKSPQVAVSFDEGGLVYCPYSGQRSRFGFGLVRPVTAFTEQDDLIAADAHGVIEVYRVKEGQPDLVATISPRPVRVIGVETFDRGRFCVCYEDGVVDSYRLRR